MSLEQKNLTKDLKQKARVKWAVEGDENSRYFHAMVRGRRNKNDVKGLLINGTWNEEPSPIKDMIYDFFKNHFEEPQPNRLKFTNARFKRFDEDDSKALEAPFTDTEIRNVVWLCGGSKAPGPDGFNFDFIKANWDVMGKDIRNAIRKFEATGEPIFHCPHP